jgi:hypothetical protein
MQSDARRARAGRGASPAPRIGARCLAVAGECRRRQNRRCQKSGRRDDQFRLCHDYTLQILRSWRKLNLVTCVPGDWSHVPDVLNMGRQEHTPEVSEDVQEFRDAEISANCHSPFAGGRSCKGSGRRRRRNPRSDAGDLQGASRQPEARSGSRRRFHPEMHLRFGRLGCTEVGGKTRRHEIGL